MNASRRLIQITDLHLRETPGDILASGLDTDESLCQVLGDILRTEGEKRDVLITGDLVQEPVAAAYQRLRQVLLDFPFRYYCLPGNHDDPRIMREELACESISTSAFIRFGDWDLIMLDSTVAGAPHGRLGEDEISRLRQRLADGAGRHALVALHHHPVPVRSPWIDRMALTDSGEFFEVLKAVNSVRGVLFGHVHQLVDVEQGGVRLLATPSTCVQFRPGTLTFDLDDLGPAWRWLELGTDGRLETGVRYLPVEYQQQSA